MECGIRIGSHCSLRSRLRWLASAGCCKHSAGALSQCACVMLMSTLLFVRSIKQISETRTSQTRSVCSLWPTDRAHRWTENCWNGFPGVPPGGRIYGGSHIPSAIAAPCEDCLGKIFGGKNFSEFGYRGGVGREFFRIFLEGWSWRKLSEMGLSGGMGKIFCNYFFCNKVFRENFLVGVLRVARIVSKNLAKKFFQHGCAYAEWGGQKRVASSALVVDSTRRDHPWLKIQGGPSRWADLAALCYYSASA